MAGVILAGVYFQVQKPNPLEYREVFLTDAPADLREFYITIEDVRIGPEQYALPRVLERVNILAHRGIDGAILIAAGLVPPSPNPYVRVVFGPVEGCLEAGCVALPVKNAVLEVAAPVEARAIMVDLDVDSSLQPVALPGSAPGTQEVTYTFDPQVQAVWSKSSVEAYADWKPTPYDVAVAEDPAQVGFGTRLPALPTSGTPSRAGGEDGPADPPTSGATTGPGPLRATDALPDATAGTFQTATNPLPTSGLLPPSGGDGTTTPATTPSTSSAAPTSGTATPSSTSSSSGPTSSTTPGISPTTTPATTSTSSPTSTTTTPAATTSPTGTTTQPVVTTTTTTTAPANRAPNLPSAASPADSATRQLNSVVLSFSGGDPDAGQTVTYNVYLSTSNPPPTTSPLCSGTTIGCSASGLQWGTTYYWQVKATDNGNPSQTTWGPVWRFTTNRYPTTPYNPSPYNGASDMWVSLYLYWSGGDPDGTTPTYTVQFGTAYPPTTTICTTTGGSCYAGSLSYSTTYYWRVTSTDGTLTTQGSIWQFRTQEAPPPYCDLLTFESRMSLSITDPCHITIAAYS